jgi:ribosomal protein S18 acetylase RimI-like enzyme
LEKLNVEDDVKRVQAALADRDSRALRFVAELEGKIVGMGVCGYARDKDSSGTRAEVDAIYLLDEAKRQGIGKSLMREMAEQLMANGYRSLQVNVLEQNAPARRFYESLGGKLSASGVFKYDGFELPDVTYVWEDMATLLKS